MKRKNKSKPTPTLATLAAQVEELQAQVAGLSSCDCDTNQVETRVDDVDHQVRKLAERLEWFFVRVRSDFVPVFEKWLAQLDRIEAGQKTVLLACRATRNCADTKCSDGVTPRPSPGRKDKDR